MSFTHNATRWHVWDRAQLVMSEGHPVQGTHTHTHTYTHSFLEKGNPYLSYCIVNFFLFLQNYLKMELMPLSES